MLTLTQRLIDRLLALRNRHFLGLDLLLLFCSPWLAFAVRTDGLSNQPSSWDLLARYTDGLIAYTIVALLVRVSIFYLFGLYRRYWRYASIEELDRIAWAVFLSTAILVAIIQFSRLPQMASAGLSLSIFPRSVVLIDGLLVLILVGGVRFSVRLATRQLPLANGKPAQRVLVMGAGDAGVMIVRELRKNGALGLEPVGFVDDNPAKRRVHIHDVPVLGNRLDIPDLVREYKIAQVIIAMPTTTGATIREIVRICDQAGVRAQIVPGLGDLLDGRASVNHLREVRIEDLLRREPVRTDVDAVAELLRGKRVLVTGAGGSIGSELCRQILRCNPSALILLGHGENSIFEIHNELLQTAGGRWQVAGGNATNGPYAGLQSQIASSANFPPPVLIPVIADIRFGERLHQVFQQHHPQIVFHAAAHKHVPLMEMNPIEAVTNNVQGTENVVAAALAANVERFVMISTDKAVNPTSIMGVSKRAAELLVHRAAKESGRPYVAVRFGNVLGSRGSVVLTFQRQIAAGGPVTVTHPEMKRFFMTIPEAVQLVLQAAVLGSGGEAFVLDMGEAVRIADLARDLIELSGLRVGEDVEIVFTGMRPGEKLYEELFIEGEDYARTRHYKIFLSVNAGLFTPVNLSDRLQTLYSAAQQQNEDAIIQAFGALVAEFQPAGQSVVGNGRTIAGDGKPSRNGLHTHQ